MVSNMSKDIVSVKLPPEDKTLIEKISKARGEDISSFIRRSIRKELASLSFLSDEDKVALGLDPNRRGNPEFLGGSQNVLSR